MERGFFCGHLREPPARLGIHHAPRNPIRNSGFLLYSTSLRLYIYPITVRDAQWSCIPGINISQRVGVFLTHAGPPLPEFGMMLRHEPAPRIQYERILSRYFRGSDRAFCRLFKEW